MFRLVCVKPEIMGPLTELSIICRRPTIRPIPQTRRIRINLANKEMICGVKGISMIIMKRDG
ncbi:MAG: hypothetical protein AAGA26_12550, partial [Pseudomonadota bacterium]